MLESQKNDTACAIALSVLHLKKFYALPMKIIFIVLPSDHYIENDESPQDALRHLLSEI